MSKDGQIFGLAVNGDSPSRHPAGIVVDGDGIPTVIFEPSEYAEALLVVEKSQNGRFDLRPFSQIDRRMQKPAGQ